MKIQYLALAYQMADLQIWTNKGLTGRIDPRDVAARDAALVRLQRAQG